MNETNNEEPLVTDNSVVNVPVYFKLLECIKKFLNKLDTTCEWACMATLKENYDTELLKYQQARMTESKKK